MGFETSKFGYDGGATTADSFGVHNHYGPRFVDKATGVTKTTGFSNELTMDIDPDLLNEQAFALLAPQIPDGARVESVYLEVDEVFDTDASVSFGTEGSEATNGVTFTSATMNAEGTYNATDDLAGTWATSAGSVGLRQVGIAYTGTATTVGKARLVITYIDMK